MGFSRTAKNFDDGIKIVKALDVKVGPVGKGRTTESREKYCLSRFLLAGLRARIINPPFTIESDAQGRYDALLTREKNGVITIEVTEVTRSWDGTWDRWNARGWLTGEQERFISDAVLTEVRKKAARYGIVDSAKHLLCYLNINHAGADFACAIDQVREGLPSASRVRDGQAFAGVHVLTDGSMHSFAPDWPTFQQCLSMQGLED